MRLLVAVASVAVASVAVASVVVAAAATAVMVAITISVTVSVGTAAAVAPAPLRHTRSRTCSALMVLVRLVKIQGWWFSILALLSPGKKKALALGRDSSLRPCNGARPPLRRRQCRGCTPLLLQRLLPPTRLPRASSTWCETAARSARWSQGLRESTSTGCTCAASPSTSSPTRRWRRHLSSCARSSCIVTCDVSATLHCKIFV